MISINKKQKLTENHGKKNHHQMLRITRAVLRLLMLIGLMIIVNDNIYYCMAAPSPLQLPLVNTLSSSSLLSSPPSSSTVVDHEHLQETTVFANENYDDTNINSTLSDFNDSDGTSDDGVGSDIVHSVNMDLEESLHKMSFKRISDTSRVGNLTRNYLGDIFNVYGKLI